MVTLSVDQVVFRQPIHVGELVTFLASVNYTGRTSMEIGIKVVTENIRNQVVRHTNSCYFTMVAVDDDGKPAEVPMLAPANAEEQELFEAAQQRRELRQEMEQRRPLRRSQCPPRQTPPSARPLPLPRLGQLLQARPLPLLPPLPPPPRPPRRRRRQ